MKIYLSGGITKVPDYKKVFQEAGDKLKTTGLDTKNLYVPKGSIEIINPVELPHNHNHTYWSYMRECIENLTRCRVIYMLKGWWKSKGARIELLIAWLLNIPAEFEK